MRCALNDGKDTVVINNIDKYCYEHYQIRDSLWKLYQKVLSGYGYLSWHDYLTRVLDTNNKENWKAPLIDASSGKTLDSIASLARKELEH